MKRRFGFVSNSSSSSYIVLSREKPMDNDYFNLIRTDIHICDTDGKVYVPNDKGQTEFGWQVESYNGFLDKLNFVFCQIGYLIKEDDEGNFEFPPKEGKAQEFLKMLEEALLKKGLVPHYVMTEKDAEEAGMTIFWKSWEFYIDHQSCAKEGNNLQMFRSQEDLENFLFNWGSYIQCDNDNR